MLNQMMFGRGDFNLNAACWKTDITPPVGTPIGGNVRDDQTSKGIHDPLFANLLYLSNRGTGILLIGLDVIGVDQSLVKAMKEGIQSACGIPEEHIAIFATHTHSGPDLMEAFKTDDHPLIKEYKSWLVQQVIEAGRQCVRKTWGAKVKIGRADEDSLSFNRRLVMKDGTVRMNWEDIDPEAVSGTTGGIDPELLVLSVFDLNNRLRSLVVNFTLHPAVLVGQDGRFSRDYIHFLTRGLEEHFDRDLVVLFANGAEGNINHININHPDQPRDYKEAERIGRKLANQVLAVFDRDRSIEQPQLQIQTEWMRLPCRPIRREQYEEAKQLLAETKGFIPSLLDGVPDEMYALELVLLYEEGRKSLTTPIQVAAVQDSAFVFLPGEFFVEFGLEIKKKSPFVHTFIVGMANDYIGYVPTAKAIEEGGYEVRTARTSRLTANAGNVVVARVVQMLKVIHGSIEKQI